MLPEIEGVNQADGLKRVAGSRSLYRDLLGQFAAKQGDAAVQISAGIEGGDRQLAERIAHTVKGVAGNIGVTGVQSAAQKLEKAIREGQDIPELLSEFAGLMSTQARAIEQALRDSRLLQRWMRARRRSRRRRPAAAITRLKILLEASDGDAEEAFRGVQTAVAGAVEKAQLDALGASISEFDFEAALLKLDEIAERLQTN